MSAFNNLVNQVRDRDWGGTNSAIAAEPYISGYSYISWAMPDRLVNYVSNSFILNNDVGDTNVQTHISNVKGNADVVTSHSIGDVLEHAMMSVTPPGGTINRVQFQGLGGKKWAVPGGIDYGDTISIKYTEFSGLPINRIHRAWCNMIRDNKIGLTGLGGTTNGGVNAGWYYKHDYSATLLYWTTKPDGVTVEFACGYSGLFPTKDPMDLFNGDITAIDKLEIEIEYNVDMIHNEKEVWETCRDLAKMNANGSLRGTRWSRDGFRTSAEYTGRTEAAMRSIASQPVSGPADGPQMHT